MPFVSLQWKTSLFVHKQPKYKPFIFINKDNRFDMCLSMTITCPVLLLNGSGDSKDSEKDLSTEVAH